MGGTVGHICNSVCGKIWTDNLRQGCLFAFIRGRNRRWLSKVCQRSGCRLQRTSVHFFLQLEWSLRFCKRDLGTVIKTTFTPSVPVMRLEGGLALVALSWFPPCLFPTSDSFTAGRPWEKSLRRRNSSQFGQCKALKASSIVFSNAALTAVVIILHSQNRQKSRFPQPLVEESQMNNSTSSIRCISFRKTYLLYFPGQWVGELSKY